MYSILFILAGITCLMQGQESYLEAAKGYKALDTLSRYTNFSAFDVGSETLYGTNGDTIFAIHLGTGLEIETYIKPEGYEAYSGFLTLSPSEEELWAGYTVDENADDRIFRIDIASGEWNMAATLPGNMDLVFLNDSILVTGLDTSVQENPCALFVLDTTGTDHHRKIIETGGFSTGLAVDSTGTTYMGTAFLSQPNGLFRWSGDTVLSLLNQPDTAHLTLEDADRLSDLPASVWDCELDAAGDLLFTFNDFMAYKVLALWDGTSGAGFNFDTLAVATGGTDWLNYIRADGSVRSDVAGNFVYTLSNGRPLSMVHADYRPVKLYDIPNFSAREGAGNDTLDLTGFFTDPDDPEAPLLELTVHSEPSVAAATLVEADRKLVIDYGQAGQTNLSVTATSNGLSVTSEFVAGVMPRISGDDTVIDFGDLTLEEESFWNGSDGSGRFTSGPARFYNDYNAEYFSWSGWAYSNTSDMTTPGWSNQYSAITGGGIDPDRGSIYAVGNNYGSTGMVFNDSSAREVRGFFVTNTTYAVQSMKLGDFFAKVFGGSEGTDQDWFRLSVEGFSNGISTGNVDFDLADYTYPETEKDYIIETWQWVELSSLGSVDSLAFSLSSSDAGDFGMNTPAYFAIDNLYVVNEATSVPEINGLLSIRVYPNPSGGHFRIETGGFEKAMAAVYDLRGRMVIRTGQIEHGQIFDLTGLPSGSYILEVSDGMEVVRKIVIKQ